MSRLPEPGERWNDRYEITAELGRGGFGRVYRAWDPLLERDVAIKMLRLSPDFTPTDHQRFKREANIAASLGHRNIVTVFDGGEHDDLLYLVMLFVPGRDLRYELEEGPLAPERAASIVDQVGGALDYAHDKGLVHRDVKPGNILCHADSDAVFLADFGISRRVDQTTDHSVTQGLAPATVAYAAPEQMRTRTRVDGRADQYGLGCVLFECLTGRRPFDGEIAEMITAHLHDDPPSVTDLRPELSVAWNRVISTAMAKDPAERFERCAQLAHAARLALPPPSRAARQVTAAVPSFTARTVPMTVRQPPPDSTVPQPGTRRPAHPAPPNAQAEPPPATAIPSEPRRQTRRRTRTETESPSSAGTHSERGHWPEQRDNQPEPGDDAEPGSQVAPGTQAEPRNDAEAGSQVAPGTQTEPRNDAGARSQVAPGGHTGPGTQIEPRNEAGVGGQTGPRARTEPRNEAGVGGQTARSSAADSAHVSESPAPAVDTTLRREPGVDFDRPHSTAPAGTTRRPGSGDGGDRPRRRRFAGPAALGLAVVAVVAIVAWLVWPLIGSPSDSGDAATATAEDGDAAQGSSALDDAQRELLAAVDAFDPVDCRPSTATELAGQQVAVACASGDQTPTRVVFRRFASATERDAALTALAGSADTGGDCRTADRALHDYRGADGPGRVVCVVAGDVAGLSWSVPDQPIMGSARIDDATRAGDLYTWWDTFVQRSDV